MNPAFGGRGQKLADQVDLRRSNRQWLGSARPELQALEHHAGDVIPERRRSSSTSASASGPKPAIRMLGAQAFGRCGAIAAGCALCTGGGAGFCWTTGGAAFGAGAGAGFTSTGGAGRVSSATRGARGRGGGRWRILGNARWWCGWRCRARFCHLRGGLRGSLGDRGRLRLDRLHEMGHDTAEGSVLGATGAEGLPDAP